MAQKQIEFLNESVCFAYCEFFLCRDSTLDVIRPSTMARLTPPDSFFVNFSQPWRRGSFASAACGSRDAFRKHLQGAGAFASAFSGESRELSHQNAHTPQEGRDVERLTDRERATQKKEKKSKNESQSPVREHPCAFPGEMGNMLKEE